MGEVLDRTLATRVFAQAAIFFEGRGVPRDLARAAALFRRAAELGHAKAQFNLGLMYARGIGVVQDLEQARVWLSAAARGGEPKAAAALRQVASATPATTSAHASASRHAAPNPSAIPDPGPLAAAGARAEGFRRALPRWLMPAAAGGGLVATIAFAIAAWPALRDLAFPPQDLASLAASCSVTGPYGQPIAFRATAFPASFRPSAKEACDLARDLDAQHRAEGVAVVAKVCTALQPVVREFGGGDYDRAARALQRVASSEPQARGALNAIAMCRTPEARAEAANRTRAEIASQNPRLAIYSVGQFVHEGRACRGYLEEMQTDKGPKGTTPWGTGFTLRGTGDCVNVALDPKVLFHPVRNPAGMLPGDLYRTKLRYDGELPAMHDYRGVAYNFASDPNPPPPPKRASGAPEGWAPNVKSITAEQLGALSLEAADTRAGRVEVAVRENDGMREDVLLIGGREHAAVMVCAGCGIGLHYLHSLGDVDILYLTMSAGGNAVAYRPAALLLKSTGIENLELVDGSGTPAQFDVVMHDEREARFAQLDGWGGRTVWAYRDSELRIIERVEGRSPKLVRNEEISETEALADARKLSMWHGRPAAEILAFQPALAGRLAKAIPPRMDQCVLTHFDWLRLERVDAGALQATLNGSRAEGGLEAILYLHPSGEIHFVTRNCDRNGALGIAGEEGLVYLTNGEPAAARPLPIESWLKEHRAVGERIYWASAREAKEILPPAQPAPIRQAPRRAVATNVPGSAAGNPGFRSEPACDALRGHIQAIQNNGMPPEIQRRQLAKIAGGRAAAHCMR